MQLNNKTKGFYMIKLTVPATLLTLGLSGCMSTPEPHPNSLDLTADNQRVKDYWQVVLRVNPKYPSKAVKKRVAGCTKFEFVINEQGIPQDFEVVKSYPEGVFDKNILTALKKWRWKPAIKNSANQAVRTSVQLDMNLAGVEIKPEVKQACSIKKGA